MKETEETMHVKVPRPKAQDDGPKTPKTVWLCFQKPETTAIMMMSTVSDMYYVSLFVTVSNKYIQLEYNIYV